MNGVQEISDVKEWAAVVAVSVPVVILVLKGLAKLTPTTRDDEALDKIGEAAEKASPLWGLFRRKR